MQLNRSAAILKGSSRRTAVAAVAVGLLFLAACGGSDDPAEPGDDEEDGQITLTFWAARDFYLPPDQFERFMEQYPDITVEFVARRPEALTGASAAPRRPALPRHR